MAVIAKCCVLEEEEVPLGSLEGQPGWPRRERERKVTECVQDRD